MDDKEMTPMLTDSRLQGSFELGVQDTARESVRFLYAIYEDDL